MEPAEPIATALPSDQSSNAPPLVAVRAARERATASAPRRFSTLLEFAVALNRQDPDALTIARDGAENHVSLDGLEVRKLITTMWFRTVFQHLSDKWRQQLLEALAQDVTVVNHAVRRGRGVKPLQKIEYAEVKEICSSTFVPDAMRADLELILVVGRLWGEEALSRLRFVDDGSAEGTSKLGGLLQGFRS